MRRLFALIASALWFLCSGIAAMADDLEIYFGTNSNQVTYKPNVIFIMDTSGSMQATDGGPTSRLIRMQNALNEALSKATNINAGLMRFSDVGGPILYPVRDVDAGVVPKLTFAVNDPNGDASEINGVLRPSESTLVLSNGNADIKTGLHFPDIRIPAGAKILSANLVFTSRTRNDAYTELEIFSEIDDEPLPFSSSNPKISARTLSTSSVMWSSNNEFGDRDDIVSSVDIAPVIQEVFDNSNWCGGNAINVVIKNRASAAGSYRVANSIETSYGEVKLNLTYDSTTATGCIKGRQEYQVSSQENNAEETSSGNGSTGSILNFDRNNSFIGLRFENIAICQGATINDAHIILTATRNSTVRRGVVEPASMSIWGVNQDNMEDFSPHNRHLLRDLPKTSSAFWNVPRFVNNAEFKTVSLKSQVQAIVNRSGWQPLNAMGFVMGDITGVREARSYRGQASQAPRLVIDFECNSSNFTTTVRDLLQSEVNQFTATGITPIVDTLYEAALYYGGKNVDYGLTRGLSTTSSSVRRSTRVSHPESFTGLPAVRAAGCTDSNLSSAACESEYIPPPAIYNSPIVDAKCQVNNHIVLLSDGEPNGNRSVSKIESLIGRCAGSGSGKCGAELVENLNDPDLSFINARVMTHTVGFAANSTAEAYLNNLAVKGGGGFYRANDSASLLNAFNTIINSVKDVNTTFVSPGVAVNQYNRLKNRDELFFALFKPDEGTEWAGNVKKYRLSGDVLVDRFGVPAIDSATGYFSKNSHSEWSTLADGDDVRQGGAASLLSDSRGLYVIRGSGSIINSGNALHETNSSITTDELGITAEFEPQVLRTTLLQWARGIDSRDDDADGDTTESRRAMGDPIHAEPVMVNYGTQQSVIFVATNHGFLQAFDADNGQELWGLIPDSLLPNLFEIYKDRSSINHVYGLDGHLVVRTVGNNKYLYVGMRRGGNRYFAFDVTDRFSPKLMFSIDGGSAGFEQLGQTWSRPVITKLYLNGAYKDVMVFAGGYDDVQDNITQRADDSVGNAVFMVDALTGQLLWKASSSNANLVLPEMRNAIPSRVSGIDRDNDGDMDHFYVIDIVGRVFRFDVYENANGIKGEQIADLGGQMGGDLRRFYYGVDVTEVQRSSEHFYAVVVGSGFRANPLNTIIQDHVFMIKDKGPFTLDQSGKYASANAIIDINSLYDATDMSTRNPDSQTRAIALNQLASYPGWQIRLPLSEKVLSPMQIINFQVMFTTYTPAAAAANTCTPPSGSNRAYLIDLIDGAAVVDIDGDGQLEIAERFAELRQGGIAPQPKLILNDTITPTVCFGTECSTSAPSTDGSICTSAFDCLTDGILGDSRRIFQHGWRSGIEPATP